MAEYPEAIVVGTTPYQETYRLQPDQLLLRFRPEVPDEEIDEIVLSMEAETRSVDVDSPAGDNLRAAKMRHVSNPAWAGSLRDAANELMERLPEPLIGAGPVYHAENGGVRSAASPLTDAIVVRLAEGVGAEALASVVEAYDLEDIEPMSDLLAPSRYLRLPPPWEARYNADGQILIAFDLLEPLAGVDGVERVSLDWITLHPWQHVPNDTHWADQWYARRIGLEAAWDIQTGASDVWIAVIEWGFDLAHEDLAYTPNTAPDLTHFNAEQAAVRQPPPYDAGRDNPTMHERHGTAVTGIAAAILDNASGIAGVAGGCPVMPVALGPAPSAAMIAAGIRWATLNGARVVNLSLTCASDAEIIDAVDRAWATGMVLCAATGNDEIEAQERRVGFPARHVNTIAVGALDEADERKRPASVDGQCWGSQFGPEIDVVAPGVLCWSTDHSDNQGYNRFAGGAMEWRCVLYESSGDEAGNYIALFGGTSAATPQVAGLAALLLSRQPTLTNQQVRDIIERTCDKVGPYLYATDPSHPNGIWHEEVGYGRIDCAEALREADAVVRALRGRTHRAVGRTGGRSYRRPA